MKLTSQRVQLIEHEDDNEACDDSNNRNSNGNEADESIAQNGNDDLIEDMSDSSDDSLDDYDKFDIEDEVANDVHDQAEDVH